MDEKLVGAMARAIDPQAWADDLPIPTQAHTIAFHVGRAKSVALARAILPIAMEHAAGIADAFQPAERWVEGLNVDVANVAKAEIATAIRAAGQP